MPIVIPIGAEDSFKGVIDIVKMKAIIWDEASQGIRFDYEDIPAELQGAAEEWREAGRGRRRVVRELMNKYLETGALDEAEINTAIRQRTIAGEIQPMLCGTAFKNRACSACSTPSSTTCRRPWTSPVEGTDDDGNEVKRQADDGEVLRPGVQADDRPVRGSADLRARLLGRSEVGRHGLQPDQGQKERIGRILQMRANNREEIKEVLAGDIAAVVSLKDVTTGETLCDVDSHVTLERMEFPEPVISQAVEPKSKADQEKMGMALSRLAQEDPSFRVRSDEESGQTIISGMGELHLEIIVDRMKREFGVEATSASRRWPTAKRSARPATKSKASSSSSRAVAASTVTWS